VGHEHELQLDVGVDASAEEKVGDKRLIGVVR
jgi:hypothetical protein